MGLKPLMSHISEVDSVVENIRCGNGCVRDLQKLEKALQHPFLIPGRNSIQVALVRPRDVRFALQDFSQELHLEVHAMPDRFPCYLLCRVSTDWDAPDTVIDELHASSRNDFFPDERFVVLMRGGRSRTFLRLSSYRDRLREHLAGCAGDEADEQKCDEILQSAAKLVLGAAWYEDQRLPFHVSDIFGLERFRAALELLAFVLGSDLYKITTALRDGEDKVIEFFDQVYDNRPLAKVLRRLHVGEALDISEVEQKATIEFVRLNKVFSSFLSTTEAVRDLEGIELYKIVLGWYYNLEEVADRKSWMPALEEAVHMVEAQAERCTRSILAMLACSSVDGTVCTRQTNDPYYFVGGREARSW